MYVPLCVCVCVYYVEYYGRLRYPLQIDDRYLTFKIFDRKGREVNAMSDDKVKTLVQEALSKF